MSLIWGRRKPGPVDDVCTILARAWVERMQCADEIVVGGQTLYLTGDSAEAREALAYRICVRLNAAATDSADVEKKIRGWAKGPLAALSNPRAIGGTSRSMEVVL